MLLFLHHPAGARETDVTLDAMRWRWSPRVTGFLLLCWFAPAVALVAGPFAWHLWFAREHHPSLFGLFVVALLAATVAAPAAYHLLLRTRVRRWELLLLAVPFAAACLFVEPAATAVSLLMVLSASLIGRFLMERLGLHTQSLVARIAVACGVGLALLSWMLFFAGQLGGFRPVVFLILLVAPLLMYRQVVALWRDGREIGARWARAEELSHPVGAVLVVALAVLAACGTLVVLAPSIAFDALKFHIPLAMNYATNGGIEPLAFEVYSYYPQAFEVQLTMAYMLAGQAGAQTFPAVHFLLLLAMLFAVLGECGISPLARLAGVVMTASLPYFHWTGVNTKSDVLLGFFSLAALYGFLRWRTSRDFRWILLGVFFLAAASCVKLPAIFAIVSVGVLYVYAWWRDGRRARPIAAAAAVFLVFGVVWQVRTWSLTGNPVYPNGADESVQTRVTSFTTRPELSRLRYTTYYMWPWWMVFDGDHSRMFNSPSPNPMGVALVLFLPLWILLRGSRSGARRACWVFLGVFVLYWIQLWPILRYAMAPVALLLGLLGERVTQMILDSRRTIRAGGYVGLAASLFFAYSVIFIIEINAPQFRLLAGQVDKRAFLREALLTYRSLEYLGGVAGPEDAVFGINNCSRAYAPDPDQFDCSYEETDAEDFIDIEQSLSRTDFRYLVLPADPAYAPVLETQAKERMLEHLYADESFEVYRMTPREPADAR